MTSFSTKSDLALLISGILLFLKNKISPTTINASSFLEFNADKIGADQVWDERQFLDNESRDALERAKASSFPQFADRWEHHLRQQQEEQNM